VVWSSSGLPVARHQAEKSATRAGSETHHARRACPARQARPAPTTRAERHHGRVAALLVRHGFNAVLVVLGGRVIGIVTRRDLLAVLARTDQAIRAEVERLLTEELGGHRRVEATDGVVTLAGFAPGQETDLAGLLTRTVPGVVEVRVTAAP
jgi:CBS domain-containing protein